MSKVSLTFPIDGISVCHSLESSATPDEQWVVRSIETLTSKDSMLLGDLWRRSRVSGFTVSTRELCEALYDADQVINLDVRLLSNESIGLLIDDGLDIVNYLK